MSKLQGAYIAPSDGLSLVSILGADWLAAHRTAVKPSTFHSDESAWRIHVKPKWGARAVGSIRHTEVQTWISKLAAERSPTTVSRVHGVLAVILDGAVKDKRITVNPARELKLPRRTSGRRAYLSHQQVERLAVESKYPDFVRFLAYTGLRWGEATGLRVRHVDPATRRLRIEENAVSVNGYVVVGTPKTHERRSVVYPAFLDSAIALASQGKSADALLWGDGVIHLTQGHAHKGWFMGAVMRVCAAEQKAAAEATRLKREEPPIMPRVTPHDLRHTAASLAISAGANVKAVQRMLGHASAAMTLDRYADLFEDDLDGVAEALDAARRERLQQ
ncbi:site-specific integrase [Cryobacterium sp. M23]|uniref:tyrosine-type recombinase/integrase n=1 Tax=Cryobacterium sp. M23 TaxID=2048292 RepID=UPI001E3C9795|nr:site-specific integrase [Cryobacterium sp. M23]